MKNKTKFLTTIMAMAIAVFLSGCSGKDGATGPQGPQGAAGSNGVANISLITYNISSWSGTGPWYTATETNFNIASADLVEAYVVSSGDLFAIPLSNYSVVGDEVSFVLAPTSNQITFDYYNTSSAPTGTWTFAVAIIPPAIMKQHPNTNWNDYSQVKAVMATEATFKK